MQIKTGLRLQPFSHEPGVCALIPGTTWQVQLFPALLKFKNLGGSGEFEFPTGIKGPVEGFLVRLDLERGRLEVSGRGAQGFFRFFLSYKGIFGDLTNELELGSGFIESIERLSLGVHKSQEWEMIWRRLDVVEIMPFWLRLAALIPSVGEGSRHPLLQELENTQDKTVVLKRLKMFWQVAFSDMLVPHFQDVKHLGLGPFEEKGSVLNLLHGGARVIRRLFIEEKKGSLHLLPCLPPECHAGRFVAEEVAFEWSKKALKKVILSPLKDQELILELPKGIGHFRVRLNPRDKGRLVSKGESLFLKAYQKLFLDKFSF